MGKKRGKVVSSGTNKSVSRQQKLARSHSLSGNHHSEHHQGHKDFLENIEFEIKHEVPVGIKILAMYTLALALIYDLAAIISPTTIIFGKLVAGIVAKLINSAYAVVLVILAYGFVTRKHWVWKASLVWYGYSILDSIVSGFSINAYFDLLMNLIVMFLLFTLLANMLMFWYVYKKKTYFFKHVHPRVSQEDKVFKMMLALIVVFFAVVSIITIAKFFYDTSKIVNKVVIDLKLAFPGEENSICKGKDLPDRDVCYLTLSIMKKDTNYCRAIAADFYKMTCYRGDFMKLA
ncbi:MAG: hypothetical protein Q8O89_00580 [Nanoarchaeota archaeon]|nr:hypothetical protein [Nanoarchaeota archaeon]